MRFGKTLLASIYPPWREHYIDYNKLKQLLREVSDSDDSEAHPSIEREEWTDADENRFVDELINVQLEKVHKFHREMNEQLKERTTRCEGRLESLVTGGGQIDEAERKKVLEETLKELDAIARDVNELERFSRINFTGFLKAAKKHDRRSRGAGDKGKGKGKQVAAPKVKPLLQVRLSHLEFNKEDYSPLLYRLSTMYDFVRRSLHEEQPEGVEPATTTSAHPVAGNKKYTSHKFWVHPDNIIEVKTFVLRRLPVLVYNPQPSTELSKSAAGQDPSLTSLYFDSPKFQLYTDKVLKTKDASSLRLRWYGKLSEANEIFMERKTIRSEADDSEGAVEERIALKKKYVNDFINGRYSMEKQVQKTKDRKSEEEGEKYEALVQSFQRFIQENDLQPALRASYTRTAFQIPGDDRVRVSLDTDLALIREDALDSERPCREPDNWHRRDIDDAKMDYPFSNLRTGEISRFPYALLEIKLRENELPKRTVEWVQELMASHLVHAAPRFSKFVHGVAVLFDDYVNSFPFWLGELEEDIRKDPRKAWDAEQERKKKQNEEELAVGSLRATARDFGGRGTPLGSYRATPTQGGHGAEAAPKGDTQTDTKMLAREGPEIEEIDDSEEETHAENVERSGSTLSGLRQLFPSFSSSRYGRAHSGRRDVILPAGVRKPERLLMYSGEVKVEAKVWLANQRTFIKWMHIVVLLASLSVALANAAGPENKTAKFIAYAYTGIAIFAGIWGWAMYMWRSTLIRQRSGKDFDSVFGPLVVCLALAVALVVNFILRYHAVTAGPREAAQSNETIGHDQELRRMLLGGEEL
ncbi:VTC domain-containing protein [Sphaerosporella brunnea]|uniref:VTC domain-containing protein n=1 Tax=Sphaerosporella brunnea TaxID=1250544 RepID=A0A5J5EFM0_9PEZI|nr:VTC domain-containing protein [Sphaerosporella brunnea]